MGDRRVRFQSIATEYTERAEYHGDGNGKRQQLHSKQLGAEHAECAE